MNIRFITLSVFAATVSFAGSGSVLAQSDLGWNDAGNMVGNMVGDATDFEASIGHDSHTAAAENFEGVVWGAGHGFNNEFGSGNPYGQASDPNYYDNSCSQNSGWGNAAGGVQNVGSNSGNLLSNIPDPIPEIGTEAPQCSILQSFTIDNSGTFVASGTQQPRQPRMGNATKNSSNTNPNQ